MIESITFIRVDGEKARLDRSGGLPDLDQEELIPWLEKKELLPTDDRHPRKIEINGRDVVIDYRKEKQKDEEN